MSKTQRIVCLANSRRGGGGRSIAGKEWPADGTGTWVRPVSDPPNERLGEKDRQYKGGKEPKPLDILDIPFLEQKPYEHQTENRLIKTAPRWKNCGQVEKWDELLTLVDPVEDSWFSKTGWSDRIGIYESDEKLNGSLVLIHVEELALHVVDKRKHGGSSHKVRATFYHSGRHYNLAVTDAVYEEACQKHYENKGTKRFFLDESCLTINVPGTPKGNFYYKLVAGIIEKERF